MPFSSRSGVCMEKHIICISCPVGCKLTVFEDSNAEIMVTGNLCHRGGTYGREEFSNPKRVVTATVKTSSRMIQYAPVKTDKALRKEEISLLLVTLKSIKAMPPIRIGDIAIRNFNGTDVNIVFTRTIEK
jgi:CxxC motif-containing protein